MTPCTMTMPLLLTLLLLIIPCSHATTFFPRTILAMRGGDSSNSNSNNSNVAWKVQVDPLTQELPPKIARQAVPAFSAANDNDKAFEYPKPLQQQSATATQATTQEAVLDSAAIVKEEDSTTTSTTKLPSPSKFSNLLLRTFPAILMLSAVTAIAVYGKEDGLICLAILLQIGMFQEACTTIGGGTRVSLQQWYWFISSGLIAIDGTHLLPWANIQIRMLSYGMAVLGIMYKICRFTIQKSTVLPEDFREYIREAAVAHLSMILVVLPSSYWIATLEDFGRSWILHSSLLVVINDTMAYIFGMAIGRHKLVPTISSKKTWEGFIGGMISTLVFAWYYFTTVGHKFLVEDAVIPFRTMGMHIALFVSLIAPFGGFLASLIKRAYGHKDFGTHFPGHGGFVDRFDCHVLTAPFVYLYLSLRTSSAGTNFIMKMAGEAAATI